MAEKNRRIHLLESEIEDLRARERREADSLEYTLRLQMERNLKQAMVSVYEWSQISLFQEVPK